MPIVLMALLSQSLGRVLLFEGYDDTPGSMHTAPGMACVFAFFSIAIVGFAIFREHGWRTWPRLRAAGIGGPALLVGKLTVPAGLLVRAARRPVRLRRGRSSTSRPTAPGWPSRCSRSRSR